MKTTVAALAALLLGGMSVLLLRDDRDHSARRPGPQTTQVRPITTAHAVIDIQRAGIAYEMQGRVVFGTATDSWRECRAGRGQRAPDCAIPHPRSG